MGSIEGGPLGLFSFEEVIKGKKSGGGGVSPPPQLKKKGNNGS